MPNALWRRRRSSTLKVATSSSPHNTLPVVGRCSPARHLSHVVFPLALPGLTASAIFAFVISWNEVFASAVLMIQNRTLPAFLLQSLETSTLAIKFAGGALLVVPAAVFMFMIRRQMFAMWGISSR
jgi:multiple sugar transport system permease protein